jgi:hypothetical protein
MSDPSAPPQKPVVKDTVRARGAVKGHNVRYVLAFSLAGVILAFIIVALFFF